MFIFFFFFLLLNFVLLTTMHLLSAEIILNNGVQPIQYAISPYQGPVVQSVVSLTISLRVISLTVLADSICNILIFFAEKM